MIHSATASDLPDLVPLLRALNAYHAAHVPGRFHDSAPDNAIREVLSQDLANGARFLLYRTEGVARAYLKWLPQPQGHPALEHPQSLALLDHIHVEPICRRRGFATRLIARFEDDIRAEGFTGWSVRVHAFNTASATLMQRHGAQLSVQAFTKTYAPASESSPSTIPR